MARYDITPDDFEPRLGPRAKVERAKEHLAEFKRELDTFVASNPYTFGEHVDPDGTRHIVLQSQKPIPLRAATIIGDILQNCRSALDLLVTCAGYLETNVFKNLDFPIFAHRSDFEAKGLNKFGKDRPRTVRFLQLLKPYERGNDFGLHSNALTVLNRLSNRDSHNLVVPVGTAALKAIVRPAPGHGEPFELSPPDHALLHNGDVIMTLSPADPLFANKKFETHLTIQIRLSGLERAMPMTAHGALTHLVKVVDRIIGIAERTLLR